MKRGELAAILFLGIIIAALPVSSIGLRAPDLKLEIPFEPYYERVLTYKIATNADMTMDYSVEVEGDLAKYVTLSDTFFEDVPSGEIPRFTVTLKLPAEIEEPGIHEIGIIATEEGSRAGSGSIGIRTSTRARILIDVPFPYLYAETRLEAKDIRVDEPLIVQVHVTNKGQNDIGSATSTVKLYDKDGRLIKESNTGTTDIARQSTQILEATIPTEGIRSGIYTVVAETRYDSKESTDEKKVRIGDLDVEILEAHGEIYAGSIGPVNITVMSMWNEVIDAKGTLTIDQKSIPLPGVTLHPWENTTIQAYWDASGLEPGSYPATVKIEYEGRSSEKLVYLDVREKGLLQSGGISPILIAVLVIIIIMLADLIYVINKKR